MRLSMPKCLENYYPEGEILLPVNKTPYKIVNNLNGKAEYENTSFNCN